MPVKGYENYDLLIVRADNNFYAASVIQSPAGETTRPQLFKLPFAQTEFTGGLDLIGGNVRRFSVGAENDAGVQLDPKTFGIHLYQTVFAEQVGSCLQRSLDLVDQKEFGLRIRLRLTDVPELAELPWEYLRNPDGNNFYALSDATPIVRYLNQPRVDAPLHVDLPLRILAVISDPSDASPRLNVVAEWARLQQALIRLQTQGSVVLERLEKATLPQLQERLRQVDPIHILHFIGHGYFANQAGGLQMEAEDGHGSLVSAEMLGVLFADHPSLRLLFLNACEGAHAVRIEPFGGAAQYLVQQGLSAVIAMQFAVTDKAAIALSEEFYKALADHYPVDAALAEARKAVFFTGSAMEWGTPVLFMRAPDGQLFTQLPIRIPIATRSVIVTNTGSTSNNTPIIIDGIAGGEQGSKDKIKDWFVNRTRQYDGFLKMVARTTTRQIMVVEAPTQMGKTWLIQRLQRECGERKLPVAYFNFRDRHAWDYKELVCQACEQIAAQQFNLEQFNALIKSVNESIGVQADSQVRQVIEARITAAFIDCVKTLAQEQIVVFLFDSYEEVTAEAEQWLRLNFLARLRDGLLPKVIVVIAGRNVPKFDDAWTTCAASTDLAALDSEHVAEYIQRRGLDTTILASVDLSIKGLMFASDGQPGLLAKMADNVLAKLMPKKDDDGDWI